MDIPPQIVEESSLGLEKKIAHFAVNSILFRQIHFGPLNPIYSVNSIRLRFEELMICIQEFEKILEMTIHLHCLKNPIRI